MTNSGSRYIRTADRALVWSRSGGVCGFPECAVQCVEEANSSDPSVVIGQFAHIEANADRGPRANPSLSVEERNSYPNLLLLCPTHHRIVDARTSTYDKDTLRAWKTGQESRFGESLVRGMESITFAELETVTQALVNSGSASLDSITIIPPGEKMARNQLSDRIAALLNVGLLQVGQVQDFVEKMGGLDSTFIDRLISGFVSEYQLHRSAGLQGDALFEKMRLFSSQGRSDIRYQASGLAVLVYLFERCEVFER